MTTKEFTTMPRTLRNFTARVSCCLLMAISSAGLSWGADAPSPRLRLATIFTENMVVQQQAPIPVWGQAGPNAKVTVRFRDQQASTMASAAGVWMARLDPLKAEPGQKPSDLTVSDGNTTITLANVLVGEVWLGSGQSNMEMSHKWHVANHKQTPDTVAIQAAEAAPYPEIRLCLRFNYRGVKSDPWRVADKAAIDDFSGIMFAFGLRLQQELKVPVGLVVASCTGTPSGCWIDPDALALDAEYQAVLKTKGDAWRANPDNLRKLKDWEAAATAARAAGKPVPKQQVFEPGVAKIGELYMAGVRPLAPFAIRGVLWDQGEGFTGIPEIDQLTAMGALLRGWRKAWEQEKLPFIYIQKPSGMGCAFDPAGPAGKWAKPFAPWPADRVGSPVAVRTHEFDNVNLMCLPDMTMAIISDFHADIHPADKSDYGSRAALAALGKVYGKYTSYTGPTYASHKIEGAKVRVSFTQVGKGLAASPADRLQGFALSANGKDFLWADAAIDGETVVVSCAKVPAPVAVRYVGHQPYSNFFNKDGLPAISFRTDGSPTGK